MSTPFLSGLLTLVAADEEAALIPPAITFLQALQASKDGLARAAALAQLEGNALAAEASVPAELLSQVAPQLNAALQAQLAKAQATIAAAAKPAS